jgi:hypothetical protein
MRSNHYCRAHKRNAFQIIFASNVFWRRGQKAAVRPSMQRCQLLLCRSVLKVSAQMCWSMQHEFEQHSETLCWDWHVRCSQKWSGTAWLDKTCDEHLPDGCEVVGMAHVKMTSHVNAHIALPVSLPPRKLATSAVTVFIE